MMMQGISAEKDPTCLWLSPPEDLVLGKDEVHVWRASLKLTAPELNGLQELLSDDEIKRAGNYHFQKDRDNFIASRGVLRVILAKYLQRAPEKLYFCYGSHGKPMLAEQTGEKTISFNVAHSNGLALYAVASQMEVGIDLEYIRSDQTAEVIAKQFFSQKEIVALNALTGEARQKAFYTFWTRREACLKARGVGLAFNLRKADVQNDDNLSVSNLDVESDYAAALALKGRNYNIKYLNITAYNYSDFTPKTIVS